MHALDFEEFLWAKGYGSNTIEDMLSHMVDAVPFSAVEIDTYSSLFFDYCITGGLPRVVASYVSTGTFESVSLLQKNS